MYLTTEFFNFGRRSRFQKWPFFYHFWSFFANYINIFHKVEIQKVILRCLVCLNLNWVKSYVIFWLKYLFFHARKSIILPKQVLIPQKKICCHVFKMGIFSKLFVAVMAHIIMENADKKIKLLIICFQLEIVDKLLSFFLWASLQVPIQFLCTIQAIVHVYRLNLFYKEFTRSTQGPYFNYVST